MKTTIPMGVLTLKPRPGCLSVPTMAAVREFPVPHLDSPVLVGDYSHGWKSPVEVYGKDTFEEHSRHGQRLLLLVDSKPCTCGPGFRSAGCAKVH